MFQFFNWSDPFSHELQLQFPAFHFISIPATQKHFLKWLVSLLIEKCFRGIPVFLLSPRYLSYSISRRSYQLLSVRNLLSNNYDWVIAHNPAAFFPAYHFAQKWNARLGIDIEDYHPGEGHNRKDSIRLKHLFKQILPKADYCSYASDQIQEKVRNEIQMPRVRHFTVINAFFRKEFARPIMQHSDRIRMVWFSQYIDFQRGLEPLLEYVSHYVDQFEIHLIGNLKHGFSQEHFLLASNIFIHDPVTQEQLHHTLSEFDIGLALEPGKDLNNQLAVSNKLLAYVQAGLMPLVSETPGQLSFLKKYDIEHMIFPNDTSRIHACMQSLFQQAHTIRAHAGRRFEAAAQFDFSRVGQAFIQSWKRSDESENVPG
jgi:hypothetical protein